jgi:hypothetical protein
MYETFPMNHPSRQDAKEMPARKTRIPAGRSVAMAQLDEHGVSPDHVALRILWVIDTPRLVAVPVRSSGAGRPGVGTFSPPAGFTRLDIFLSRRA